MGSNSLESGQIPNLFSSKFISISCDTTGLINNNPAGFTARTRRGNARRRPSRSRRGNNRGAAGPNLWEIMMDAERNRNNNDNRNPAAANQDEDDNRTVMRVPSFFYALFIFKIKCKNEKMKKKKKKIQNVISCLHLSDNKVRSVLP